MTTNGASIYEVGIQELHRVSQDRGAREQVDHELNEARGREGARLHVTLKAITESDRRNSANTRATLDAIERLTSELQDRATQLSHLIQSFEATAEKRFQGVHADLTSRADQLVSQVNAFANVERDHFEAVRVQVTSFQSAISTQVSEAKTAVWQQADQNFTALTAQTRESTERLAMDVRKLRDEVVSLVDSRMNQADASFAAIRGDVEVVKYLVMDLIKDRIGRTDPKQKPF